MDSNGFKLLHKENFAGLIYAKLIGEKEKEAAVAIEREEEAVGRC